ncbi:autotransporter domain-containing protein [Pelagibacterium sp. H642]|nr:autotransporter domain-containing protein [Pelagibacterium sp. H642]
MLNLWGGEATGTLALGGDTSPEDAFDVSKIVAEATLGSSDEYVGFAAFEKTGASTWTLSGATDAITPWTLKDGTLSVSSDASLGHEDGMLTFNGGRLATTESFVSDRAVTLDAAGNLDVASGTELGLSGVIAGDGDLIKQGEGVLELSGDNNDYGNTLVAAGTLTGNAAAISGNIGNAGTVVFDQASNASFAGDIAGLDGTGGTMIKQGAGTLTLDGASALDWTVDHGGLTTGAGRFAGDVAIGADGALTFEQETDTAYGGTLSGNGLFSLDGGATVLLTGDSSGFSGITNIAGGTLLVGDAAGNGTLGGDIDVRDGATLGGSGTAGSGAGSLVTVASGGTLAPGSSIGTLTVDGDLVFDAGSRLAVEVNPEGSDSDLVEVTGNVMLDGGSVAHIGATGDYDIRSAYTILSSGTLDGEFNSVTSDFAFLDPSLLYDRDAGTVALELERNDIDFASVALTRNQKATAAGIESIGLDAGHAVYDAIARLTDDEDVIRASFDALSGEIHASAQTALIEDSRFVRNAANDRIRAAFGDAGADYAPVLAYGPGETPVLVSADHDGPVFWSSGFGSWGSTDSDGNAASLDRSTGGLLIGADTTVGDWRVGILGGNSQSRFDAEDRASSGSSDNYHLGLYGGTQWGEIAFRTGAAYTWHDIDTNRSVSIPGLTDSLSADYGAGTFQFFGELGYGIDLDQATRLEPYINLAHVHHSRDGFTEQGGAAALSGDSSTTDVTFTTLGVRAEHSLELGEADATLRGMVGWRRAFGDITPQSTLTLSGSDAFNIAGSPIARDSAVIEAGLDLNLTPEASFGISYQGQLASDAYDHGFRANLNVRF